jgi:hypothetical protein
MRRRLVRCGSGLIVVTQPRSDGVKGMTESRGPVGIEVFASESAYRVSLRRMLR